MGLGMGLNLLLLIAMVATNILSLYHLSSFLQTKPTTTTTSTTFTTTTSAPNPDHLLNQLNTIRATISHLTTTKTTSQSTSNTQIQTLLPPTSDLLLYTHISPIASSCRDNLHLLYQYMNYTPFTKCPLDLQLSEQLILRGCHPLPRRRCFATSKMVISKMGSKQSNDDGDFFAYKTELDLPVTQLMKVVNTPLRLALDVGGGAGGFAAATKKYNVTVVTTTMNLGRDNNEVMAENGFVPLHVPLQQRFPVFDGVADLVRCGHGVNRWIPVVALEFLLYDVDRVLRGGGYLWLDHFWCKGGDLDKIFTPLIGKLGYKKVKWATGNKTDSKIGEVYLTALLQKPVVR